MLSVKDRQRYLKSHRFYKGKITGVENKATRAAYLALQKRYMRPQDCDGVYGPDTDKVLLNLARVTKRAENFTLEEFKCDCGGRYCTGYPAYLSTQLLDNVQAVRSKYGPTRISSGLRCSSYNATLKGSIPTSEHLNGDAADVIALNHCETETERLEVVEYCMTLPKVKFAYAYLPKEGRTKLEKTCTNMAQSVHMNI